MAAQPTPIVEPTKITEVRPLVLHDLCKIIPPHTQKEADELLEDIRKNKLQVPIKTFEGQLLDGRGRYNACLQLFKGGVETKFRTEPFMGTLSEARDYVISTNVKRRHLSTSHRAIIAARLVTTKLGGDRKSNQSANLPTEITQEDAAKLLNVSVRSVTDAVKILPYPELVARVEKGELSVSAAAKSLDPANDNKPKKPKGQPQTNKGDVEKPEDAEAEAEKAVAAAVENVKTLSKDVVNAIARLDKDQAKTAIDNLIRDLRLTATAKEIRLADEA